MFTSKYFNVGKVVCTATLNNAMSENAGDNATTVCFPDER